MNLDALPTLDAAWESALLAGDAAVTQPGLLACQFVVRGAMHKAQKRWRQGPRHPPLPCAVDDFAAMTLATRHVFRVEEQVAAGLLAWVAGERPLHVRFSIPPPLEVLALQARGERIVSLLPEGVPTGLEPDNVEFALHDLCHAEKFFDPAHHAGQVGLFATLHRALQTDAWVQLVAPFAPGWQAEVDHVAADMNGSVLFLWAALRRKVMNAAKLVERSQDAARAELCAALALPVDVAHSAEAFTVHRDIPAEVTAFHADVLLRHFEAHGAAILAGQASARTTSNQA